MTEHAPPGAIQDPRDVAAFTELVREHHSSLLGLARTIYPTGDYELAVSDGLLRLCRHWNSITGDRVAWTKTVVRRLAIDLRRRSREEAAELHEHDPPMWAAETPIDGRLELNAVLELLPTLPPREQAALLWSAFGYQNSEIADRMTISEASVRSYLAHARKRIREGCRRPPRARSSRVATEKEV
ncbi:MULTISPECIES: RNA polymerase sigma factor [Amycolatopsis]|uniref:RNA polymerase sigma factor n=1 Tax=Amycolatopsis sp. cg13 TaxID=3238807 RepID=UPI003526C305